MPSGALRGLRQSRRRRSKMSKSSSEQSRRAHVQVLAAELYREHRARLLSIALGNASSRTDAEEALQFALVAFIEKYDPDSGAPPLPWVLLTLKRRCWALHGAHQHVDRSAGQEATPGSGERGFSVASIASEAADSEEAIERAEWLLEARQRLAALKPAERRALVLIAAGYSYREIGEMNAWSHTKVNRSAAEGRTALREALGA